MAKIYTDINGEVLSDGDEIITIALNGKAVGGDLVKAFFRIDENGKNFISKTKEGKFWECYSNFYKKNFETKVLKYKH